MVNFVINPTQLVNNEMDYTPFLKKLIDQIPTPFIPFGEYFLHFDDKIYTVKLTQSLLRRPSRQHPGQERIEVLETIPLSTDDGTSTYRSLGLLNPAKEYSFKQKSFLRSRQVKVIPFSDSANEDTINLESSHTMMNKKLKCKKPVFTEQAGFLVMREPKARDLGSLLDDLSSKKISLNIKERMELSYAVLAAYKEQVVKLGLVLTNLAPQHIMVNMDTFDVTFTNYSNAIADSGYRLAAPPKCSLWSAPETLAKKGVTPASNMYSLGFILAELWGDQSTYQIAKNGITLEAKLFNLHNREWYDLFKNLPMPLPMQLDIMALLEDMTRFSATDRVDIQKAMATWNDLQCEYYSPTGNEVVTPASTPATPINRISRSSSYYEDMNNAIDSEFRASI